jgi:hypothetical protein
MADIGKLAAVTLTLTARCLGPCGILATGTTADPPSGGRYKSRWAEVDAVAERHMASTGHATCVTASP